MPDKKRKRRQPGTTREERMLRTYRAGYTYDWLRRGEGPGPLLSVARKFRVPIVQVRGILSEEKARRAERKGRAMDILDELLALSKSWHYGAGSHSDDLLYELDEIIARATDQIMPEFGDGVPPWVERRQGDA